MVISIHWPVPDEVDVGVDIELVVVGEVVPVVEVAVVVGSLPPVPSSSPQPTTTSDAVSPAAKHPRTKLFIGQPPRLEPYNFAPDRALRDWADRPVPPWAKLGICEADWARSDVGPSGHLAPFERTARGRAPSLAGRSPGPHRGTPSEADMSVIKI